MTICFNWIVDLNAYLKTIIVVSVLIFMIYEINTIKTSTTTTTKAFNKLAII